MHACGNRKFGVKAIIKNMIEENHNEMNSIKVQRTKDSMQLMEKLFKDTFSKVCPNAENLLNE